MLARPFVIFLIFLTTQLMIIKIKIVGLLSISWWLIFIPTYIFILIFGVGSIILFSILKNMKVDLGE